MVSPTQMKALLAVACPWCQAPAGTRCRVRLARGRVATVPSTLDGESHDARWRRALGTEATVLQAEVVSKQFPSLAASADRPW